MRTRLEQEVDEKEVFLACCRREIPAAWKKRRRRRQVWCWSSVDKEDTHGQTELSGAAEEDC